MNQAIEYIDYPLTHNQLNFLTRIQADGVERENENLRSVYLIKSSLDVDKLLKSITELSDRHDCLRTIIFPGKSGHDAYQRVLSRVEPNVISVDYSGIDDESNRMEKSLALLEEHMHKKFVFCSDVLFRAIIIKQSSEQYIFGFVTHHLISDGQSQAIIKNELSLLYNSQELADIRDSHGYRKFVLEKESWDKNWKDSPKSSCFVENIEINSIEFPADKGDKFFDKIDSAKSVSENPMLVFSEGEFDNLNRLAREYKVTLFVLLISLIAAAAKKWNKNNGVLFYVVKDERTAEYRDVIGYFVSVSPIFIQVEKELTFSSLVDRVKEEYLKIFKRPWIPASYMSYITSTVGSADKSCPVGDKGEFYLIDYVVDQGGQGQAILGVESEKLQIRTSNPGGEIKNRPRPIVFYFLSQRDNFMGLVSGDIPPSYPFSTHILNNIEKVVREASSAQDVSVGDIIENL